MPKSRRGNPTNTSANPYPPEDAATRYAWDIVNRRIVAGHFAIRACQRHLDDIEYGARRGLYWRPDKAKAALEFFPDMLRVTHGAKEGEPFNLPSYSAFVVGSLYGWVRDDGRLRFRRAWLELGKGQVKSPIAAALSLYTLGFRGIPRAEVYAIAKDRNQANVLFADAVAMARAPIADRDDGESLLSLSILLARGTGEMTWMLEHPESGSKFRALAGDEKVSGPRPTLVAADEIHEWRNDGPLRIWQSAGAKMPGDFLLLMSTNTPAADQLVGTEYSGEFQSILNGEIDDDAAFAFIARVDEDDDPLNDESCWIKSMPLIGITFPYDNVRMEVNSSRHSVGRLLNTKRLYFGIPVGASEYWIDVDAWERVQGEVDAVARKGNHCWLGMDLSEKNDLTALAILWRDDEGHFYLKVFYWKPEENLAQKSVEDNAKYLEWASTLPPLLFTTPGKSINYDFVARAVQTLCAEQEVQSMAFDPSRISEFVQACDRIGFPVWVWEPGKPAGRGLKMITHSQGRAGMFSKKMLWMPRSMGQFEDLILTGQITIDDNQITKWCAGNAAVSADEFGNRYLIKKHRRGRIDGVVASPMAVGAALADFEEEPRSLAGMIF